MDANTDLSRMKRPIHGMPDDVRAALEKRQLMAAYNARPPAPEVLVSGPEWAIVRPRLSHDDLIGQDKLPDWLAL